MRRVFVTGTGSVNALGRGVPAFLAGLREGRSGIGEMRLFSTEGFRTHRAAVAPEIPPPASMERSAARRLSRSDRMALAAALEAWGAAGFREAPPDAGRVGVFVGATTGGMLEAESLASEKPPSPFAALATPVSIPADRIGIALGLGGARLTVATACSSSVSSIGLAADHVREGQAEVVLAGGVDAHCRMTFAGFNALQAIDPDVCRPFDRRRAGLSLGEGAAFLVLESEEHARRQGARALVEIAGFGMSADAHHMTAPDPEGRGAVLAMQRSLADAGIAAGAVGYVNAHGTGTPANDPVETRAIRTVFGAHADRLAVSSTKSQVGHCLGAAGAIEALATLLAITHGFLPPTLNLEEADPECDLDYVPGKARLASLEVALTNSYGFGGNNASLVLRRSET